jgi:hypothetical protein
MVMIADTSLNERVRVAISHTRLTHAARLILVELIINAEPDGRSAIDVLALGSLVGVGGTTVRGSIEAMQYHGLLRLVWERGPPHQGHRAIRGGIERGWLACHAEMLV